MSAAVATKAPASAKQAEVWGYCPVRQGGCDLERRIEAGVMVTHRAWCGLQGGMRPCPGSGFPPARFSSGEDGS